MTSLTVLERGRLLQSLIDDMDEAFVIAVRITCLFIIRLIAIIFWEPPSKDTSNVGSCGNLMEFTHRNVIPLKLLEISLTEKHFPWNGCVLGYNSTAIAW